MISTARVVGNLLLLGAVPIFAHNSMDPEPKTAAAVQAADLAWGIAEERGDVAFVDRLLAPEYRSVGYEGKSTDKTTIVARTRSQANSTVRAQKVAAWRAEHPIDAVVTLFGDTAVLNWISTKPGTGNPVSSCDIFVYRAGHWQAIYSQHTDASV